MRIIISGVPGSGKTSRIAEICRRLSQRCSIAGLLTFGEWQDGIRVRYRLHNVANGETHPFAESEEFPEAIQLGRYFVYPSALAFGLQALSDVAHADCVIVDEVGHWELNGLGWSTELDNLNAGSHLAIWGVGLKNLPAVQQRWPQNQERVVSPQEHIEIMGELF